jgi:hypothetical protein
MNDGDQPQEPSCLAGCAGWLILIIGGICFWNYWTGEIKRKAAQELERKFENINRHRESINPHMPEGWRKELERRAEEWRGFEEELRRSKNLP